jgi:hypothetical protein
MECRVRQTSLLLVRIGRDCGMPKSFERSCPGERGFKAGPAQFDDTVARFDFFESRARVTRSLVGAERCAYDSAAVRRSGNLPEPGALSSPEFK